MQICKTFLSAKYCCHGHIVFRVKCHVIPRLILDKIHIHLRKFTSENDKRLGSPCRCISPTAKTGLAIYKRGISFYLFSMLSLRLSSLCETLWKSTLEAFVKTAAPGVAQGNV